MDIKTKEQLEIKLDRYNRLEEEIIVLKKLKESKWHDVKIGNVFLNVYLPKDLMEMLMPQVVKLLDVRIKQIEEEQAKI